MRQAARRFCCLTANSAAGVIYSQRREACLREAGPFVSILEAAVDKL